jgi:hypothetical protein
MAIGQILELENKKTIYLINTGHYSNITDGHIHYMMKNIPDGAHVFSASCDIFIKHWYGYYNFNKEQQKELLINYLKKQLSYFLDFTYSKTINTERLFSLRWWEKAKEFIDVTGCCTFRGLVKYSNDSLEKRSVYRPDEFKNMINVLIKNDNSPYPVQQTIDLICGEDTYKKYLIRTKTARTIQHINKINHFLGFGPETSYYTHAYWNPYGDKNRPSRFGIYSLYGLAEGKINANIIKKQRKSGNYISFLLKTKRENFSYNMEIAEKAAKESRSSKAKEKLEKHIGFIFQDSDGITKPSFNYNGTVFLFEHYHYNKRLTIEEYEEYTSLSPEEQKIWRYNKKQWMLENLQEKTRKYDKMKVKMWV